MNEKDFAFSLEPRLERLDAERETLERKLHRARRRTEEERLVLQAMIQEVEAHERKWIARTEALREVPSSGTETWIARRDHSERLRSFLDRQRVHVEEQEARVRSSEAQGKALCESLERLLLEVRGLEEAREKERRAFLQRRAKEIDERQQDEHLPRWFLDA